MTNWKPFFWILIATFVIGWVILFTVGAFIDVEEVNPDSIVGTSGLYTFLIDSIQADLVDTIDTDISIFGFGTLDIPVINIFALFGESTQDFVVQQLTVLTYIPDEVLIPYFVIFGLAFLLFIIKLILP